MPERTRRGKRILTGTALSIIIGCGLMAGCAGQNNEEAPESSGDGYVAELYEPEVITQEDGTLIQRTPSEDVVTGTLDGGYSYHTPEPENTVPYNTYYLNADEKGCNACHDDLAKTLADGHYLHVNLQNSLGLQITVEQCIDCHTFGFGYQANQRSFGSLIHGIHHIDSGARANAANPEGGKIDCWSCHAAVGDGKGMQLWDDVKHTELRGITPVPDVQADEFSWNQDKLVPAADIFDFNWQYYDYDYIRYHNSKDNVPLDEALKEDWTITVSGAVNQEKTFKLTELIEKYGGVQVPLKFHCTYNPIGGPLISNSLYTGIPLSKVLAEAGVKPEAVGVAPTAADGNCNPYYLKTVPEAYIVYEIDGEPLPWKQGYPCQLITPNTGAPSCCKELSDIVLLTADEMTDVHQWNGWPCETDGGGDYYTEGNWPDNDSNGYMNKPNVGIFNFDEGTVVKTGEPLTITGYADAWNVDITAMEFSMDGGATWTRYPVEGANIDNWVNWSFTWTPPSDSGYVLAVRSVDAEGNVSPDPLERLFNARSDM